MHSHTLDDWRHDHVFLGAAHDRNERRTWLVVGLTATMMVALLIHGVKPGPVLMEQRPEVFWGLIASMYVGNLMLLILNLPLVGLFVNLLRVPQHFLFPGILLVWSLPETKDQPLPEDAVD